jgi:hypothetical protein
MRAQMKKLLLLCLLVLALLLAGCGEPKYKVLGDARLEDCTLTIHYEDPNIYKRIPSRIWNYLDPSFLVPANYYATVSGTELKENKQFLALLKMADKQELPPVQDITNYWKEDIFPCIYYFLADQDGKMLFDVTMGLWGGVYFNGEKVTFDKLYYTCIESYLTEPHFEK